MHSLQQRPDLTIQIPLLYLHDHFFLLSWRENSPPKKRWLKGSLQKTSLEQYLVGEMALRFCSVKLARLCPQSLFLVKASGQAWEWPCHNLSSAAPTQH
jgi:hypothetical protein